MNDETTNEFQNVKPLETGGKTLVQIKEGSDRWLKFNPHLRVDWSVWREKDEQIAYVTYDFGLDFKINLDAQRKSWWGYGCLNKESTNAEIVDAIIRFDLFHAFFHYQGDPNYSHLHWALYGNLKDRCEAVEIDEIPFGGDTREPLT